MLHFLFSLSTCIFIFVSLNFMTIVYVMMGVSFTFHGCQVYLQIWDNFSDFPTDIFTLFVVLGSFCLFCIFLTCKVAPPHAVTLSNMPAGPPQCLPALYFVSEQNDLSWDMATLHPVAFSTPVLYCTGVPSTDWSRQG